MTEPSFWQMQEGELAWWAAFLARPESLARLFAIYGYRYLPFFFEEFGHLGTVVDFGSGPVSAAFIGEPAPEHPYCVDPLMPEYFKAHLIYGEPIMNWPPDISPAIFDTALVLNVLDHCDDPPALLAQVARVLRPGGKALVWVHVDILPDALHRTVSEAEVWSWLVGAGLTVKRARAHYDIYGPRAYMAVAERPA
ncbi:MAG: class I SAM-dependent methyltransferase [Methyloceanibacter sp.]|nr:class I SAM-dependent methyltransferase [Methyloceanibacter sp.]